MKTIMIIPLLFYEIVGNLFITYYQELTTQKKMLRRNNDFFILDSIVYKLGSIRTGQKTTCLLHMINNNKHFILKMMVNQKQPSNT